MTRASIVEGAAVVFNDKGYANASLEVIAEQAQVTRGALYFHFKSKEDLANAVIEEQHRLARTDAEKSLSVAATAFEGMIRMSIGFARQLTTEIAFSAGIRLTTDGTASELSAKDPYRDWMDTFENLTGLAIEQGDFYATVQPLQVAKFIIPAYTGLQMVSDTLHEREDLFERVRDMWELLMPALILPERMAANREFLSLIRK